MKAKKEILCKYCFSTETCCTDIEAETCENLEKFDESLFKAYINKFSDEDKLNALKCLFWSLTSDQKFHVVEIGIDKI